MKLSRLSSTLATNIAILAIRVSVAFGSRGKVTIVESKPSLIFDNKRRLSRIWLIGLILSVAIIYGSDASPVLGAEGVQPIYTRGDSLQESNCKSRIRIPFCPTVSTFYDRGDSFAASPRFLIVAEDDRGIIDGYNPFTGEKEVLDRSTSYDKGDGIAIDGNYIFIAEDNGGLIEVYEIIPNTEELLYKWSISTRYDKHDRLAAADGKVYVAEDDGGTVEVYDVKTKKKLVDFKTSFDRGDDIAAYNIFFLVAEDNGGKIEVYNLIRGEKKELPSTFLSHLSFDKGDGLGAYITIGNRPGELLLVTCVAEDDGGTVRCVSRPMKEFL